MRITAIEIKNYRAFKGGSLKIDLRKAGKNLLVYGENGSGKSSLFFAALLLQPVSRLRALALDDVLIGLDMSNRLPAPDIPDQHFGEHQIFSFTYDRPWYEIVKNHIESRNGMKDWETVEFFAARTKKGRVRGLRKLLK